MSIRDRKALIAVAIVRLLLGLLALVPSLQAQAPDRSSADAGSSPLRLLIETQRVSYKLGDSIKVRLTIRNISDSTVMIPSATYTILPLRVLRSNGHEVKPSAAPIVMEAHGLAPLEAGGESIFSQNQLQGWVDLRDWGYELTEPGSYRIDAPTADGVTITVTE